MSWGRAGLSHAFRIPTVSEATRLVAGLVLSAVGTVMSLRADIGVAPWDVFHGGIAHSTPLSFGQAVILAGFLLIGVNWILGIPPGIGTVCNMVLIGLLDDALLATDIGAHLANGPIVARIPVLFIGLVCIGFGAALYISAGLGAGPRDSFQLSLSKTFNLPAGVARTLIEAAAVGIGWPLGGNANWGTAAAVFLIGLIIHASFALLHLDRTGKRTPSAPQRQTT
ncbi:hypothetical protein OG203_43725 [Nocardia sp. NBC_01499]|uniref:YczE/YyaS/YitT family protein n=1 Tax=Nocardia sp. NBC_01499 TaxID=2903597 RepID=UPI0038638A16